MTLYVACIILQYVYKPTRCTEFLWLDFIFQYTLYMFRTILVHHQEQLYKLYITSGITTLQLDMNTKMDGLAVSQSQRDSNAPLRWLDLFFHAVKRCTPNKAT